MKLFTINATPVSISNTLGENEKLVKNYPRVVASVLKSHGFDGFTMYQVQGYWMGLSEISFKIEIAIDTNPERVYTVAQTLRDMFNQDSVMVTLPNNTVKFI